MPNLFFIASLLVTVEIKDWKFWYMVIPYTYHKLWFRPNIVCYQTASFSNPFLLKLKLFDLVKDCAWIVTILYDTVWVLKEHCYEIQYFNISALIFEFWIHYLDLDLWLILKSSICTWKLLKVCQLTRFFDFGIMNSLVTSKLMVHFNVQYFGLKMTHSLLKYFALLLPLTLHYHNQNIQYKSCV